MQCLAMSTYTSVCNITERPQLVSLLQWDTWLDSPLGWPRCPGWGSTERTQRGEISGEAPLPAWPPHCSVHSRAGNEPSRSSQSRIYANQSSWSLPYDSCSSRFQPGEGPRRRTFSVIEKVQTSRRFVSSSNPHTHMHVATNNTSLDTWLQL